jgi:hypothetical protein
VGRATKGFTIGMALAVFIGLSPSVLAKGGGHGGGGHSGGGHASSGGHASGGGHASSGGHASTGGHVSSGGGQATGAGHPSSAGPSRGSEAPYAGQVRLGAPIGAATPIVVSPTPPARPSGDNPIVGTAVARPQARTSPFAATPSTYAPVFVSPFISRARLHARPFWPYLTSGFFYPVCAGPLDCAPFAAGGYPGMGAYAAAGDYGPPAEDTSEAGSGNMRLDVQPSTAQVFVDGYFVGTVEDFYHSLAGLRLEAGAHRIEFRAPGYETLVVDVLIAPGRTITYRATLAPQ